MSISPLVRIQQEMSRTVGAAAESWQSEARDGTLVLDAEDLVAAALQLRAGLRRIWESVLARARADQLRDFEDVGQTLRGLAEADLRVLTRVLDLVRQAAARTGREVRGLPELEAETGKVKTWLEGELHTWPWVESPMRPFDPEMLARADAAIARGEGEDTADILARLKAGGPLVKE